MKLVFDPCVNRTLELIDGQVASILKSGQKKPKVVAHAFLSNQFTYSVYRWCLWWVVLAETTISTPRSGSIAKNVR